MDPTKREKMKTFITIQYLMNLRMPSGERMVENPQILSESGSSYTIIMGK